MKKTFEEIKMSWRVYLVIFTGKEEKIIADVGNYPHNVSPMYHKAMGITLSNLKNMNCGDVILILEKGIKAMKENREECEKLNPKIGYGNYEGALDFLCRILEACKENPLCKILVC